MLSSAIPMSSANSDYGYNAIGVTVVDRRNDGSPVSVVDDPRIGPKRDDPTHYERMVRSICSQFRANFRRS